MSTLQTTILKHPDSSSNNIQFDSSGRVGINTSPSAPLDVVGNDGIAIQSAAQTNEFLIRPSSSSADGIRFTQAGGAGDRMVVDSSGRVGIGNSSPTSPLEVHSGSSSNIIAKSTNGNGGFLNYSGLASNGTTTFSVNHNGSAFFAATMGIGTNIPGSYAQNTGIAIRGVNQAGLPTYQGQDTSDTTAFLNMCADSNNSFQRFFDIGAVGAFGTGGQGSNIRIFTQPQGNDVSCEERMRFDRNGGIHIGKTGFNVNETGVSLAGGSSNRGLVELTRAQSFTLSCGRNTDDGNIVVFRQDLTQEGSISVSGSTVALNGGHLSRWSQLSAAGDRIEILRGSVLSNLDEMCEWAYEAKDAVLYTEEDDLPEGVSIGDVKEPATEAYVEDNEQLNRMKVSDVEGDINVSGVFQDWDNDDDVHVNDFYCAMTGDFVIRIAQGTTVERGDLLMSAGDGTAKPQGDDIVRSKTVAKVTSTTVSETYEDGSYCVPCVLMAC